MTTALVAFDKFKDALTAVEACQAASLALAAAQPDWRLLTAPIADGGDGFCDTLTAVANGSFHSVNVTGPLGETTEARYGIVSVADLPGSAKSLLALPADSSRLAIIEMAQTSGIALVPSEQRTPWTATTSGLGECIRDAAANGADCILLGIGGSATHDLGLGALQALGYTFYTRHGALLEKPPVPNLWDDIGSIDPPETPFGLPVRIACDVENPLLGSNGAAAIFGPQKGLAAGDIEKMDSETARIAIILTHACDAPIQAMDIPGTGAAGGAGFGLMTGLEGKLIPGAALVFAWSDLQSKLDQADLVITGEGRFDASSLQGKGPGSLIQLAADNKKPSFVFAGSVGQLPELPPNARVAAISPADLPLPAAIAATEKNLSAAIAQTFATSRKSIFHETEPRA